MLKGLVLEISDQSFQKMFEVFGHVRICLNLFGPFLTHSDTFGCIRMHLGDFGNVQSFLDFKINFERTLRHSRSLLPFGISLVVNPAFVNDNAFVGRSIPVEPSKLFSKNERLVLSKRSLILVHHFPTTELKDFIF